MSFRNRRNKKTQPRVLFRHQIKAMAAAAESLPVRSGSSKSYHHAASSEPPAILGLFTSLPPIVDALETESSRLQRETIDECLPFLRGDDDSEGVLHAGSSSSKRRNNRHGVPRLDRQRHVKFLHKQLGRLPPQMTAADPSRPWFFYWSLAALTLLSEGEDDDVGAVYRGRLVETVRPLQNAGGGFGGGFGQDSHLATTYATVLALMLVGGEAAYEVIDRHAMWKWLCSLKQADGGFQMVVGGEEDVRGAYCASVLISVLGIPLELSPDSPACAAGHKDLFSGLAEWVGRCQTYEGGVAAMPGIEAHGAYAFCALGCLSILDAPHRSIPKYMDVPRLIAWLSSRQYAPEGGFSGRTNKLVDGCYSHWVGGCWPLIQAALSGPSSGDARSADQQAADTGSLFSRNGLISSAQHKWTLRAARPAGSVGGADEWEALPYVEDEQIFDENDRIMTTHPIYVIPQHKIEAAWEYYASKTSC
ncbi:Terpenoid cylases/protein prenyltransferase alpha-alpha toroid [Cordyceps fumosorosea ARSEF 2679]|uniref:Terpenoid cylases/protein prenyltransferase alpha-alpha toroid n=1 Tax=Cordyceps fumosorosea (strain ARSEF 2679) TaxID=1081104 RepID=A0A162MTV5_CORFA|nr:Terpenoid cylases/protein prenyltransferase alpha-alpha toroid [Cordyceps fumosorosea ARSEF 2679]OAA70269.1 Terpenoid cylases/protein prenyltransferase alpha-alpha toroid [Cordyceps fumosorosea ARSEF 2679]